MEEPKLRIKEYIPNRGSFKHLRVSKSIGQSKISSDYLKLKLKSYDNAMHSYVQHTARGIEMEQKEYDPYQSKYDHLLRNQEIALRYLQGKRSSSLPSVTVEKNSRQLSENLIHE